MRHFPQTFEYHLIEHDNCIDQNLAFWLHEFSKNIHFCVDGDVDNEICRNYLEPLFHLLSTKPKVKKILEDSRDSIPSPSSWVKIQIMGFWKQKVCWHYPAMFCLITSSKLSGQQFEFDGEGDGIESRLSSKNIFYFI